MKIIHKRISLKNWKLEVDCTGGGWGQGDRVPCLSTLELNKDDLVKRTWNKYPDDHGVDYGFICPVCGCFTDMKEEDILSDLRKIAKDYDSEEIKNLIRRIDDEIKENKGRDDTGN